MAWLIVGLLAAAAIDVVVVESAGGVTRLRAVALDLVVFAVVGDVLLGALWSPRTAIFVAELGTLAAVTWVLWRGMRD